MITVGEQPMVIPTQIFLIQKQVNTLELIQKDYIYIYIYIYIYHPHLVEGFSKVESLAP